MKTTFKIEGLKELEATFVELSKAQTKAAMKAALKDAAEPIKEAWESNVPVRTGNYKANIIIGNKPDAGKIAYGRVMKLGGSKGDATEALKAARAQNPRAFSQIFIGAAKKIRAAIPLEFGTEKMPAKPSARPAWDSRKETALDILIERIKFQIDKKRQFVARKNARLIAKAQKGL
jgi:HK97 gp10 family phage protein